MNERKNKVYFLKYFYVLTIFLGILILPLLIAGFENEYHDAIDEYHNTVNFAVSEEFYNDEINDKILELQIKVTNAKITYHYKCFVSIMIVIIFLGLFNYFSIRVGLIYKTINNTPSRILNKYIIIVVSFVEILYFVGLLIFAKKEYIGINFWTLFFVNIIVVVFVVVLTLQLQYFLQPKELQE